MPHDYGLDWIDQDRLFEVTQQVFSKALGIRTPDKPKPLDPFTLVAQGAASAATIQEMRTFERVRNTNKTVSNAVGLWHQKVLGLAPNWEELGSNGGGVDLRTQAGYLLPRWNKPVYIEVKNRFNTIKASEEKRVWDQLHLIGQPTDAVVYLFQIVPQSAEAYDRPWNPSGRTPRDTVRVCDGVTGYALVFGRATALHDVYRALPAVIDDVLVSNGRPAAGIADAAQMEDLFRESFPPAPEAAALASIAAAPAS